MPSLEEQIHLSGAVARRVLYKDPAQDPLDAWHGGIEAVRLSEADDYMTESMIEISAIAYRGVEAAVRLFSASGKDYPDLARTVRNAGINVMYDLTKNLAQQSRRCGGYLLTAPALGNVDILTLHDGHLRIQPHIKDQLELQSTFPHPEVMPAFWRTAVSLNPLLQ